MQVLVTGASGYIATHTIVNLLNMGADVIGIDNFSNSKYEVISEVEKIANKGFKFYFFLLSNCI